MSKEEKKVAMASKMADDFKAPYAKGLKKNTGSHFEKLKKNQKGQSSLNKPKGEHNEGETMYLGKNEDGRP